MHAGIGQAPRLQISSTEVRGGESLSGTLANIGTRNIAVLLVSESGTVHNLSSLLQPEGNLRRFDIPMSRAGPPGDQPELLVAITSEEPLLALSSGGIPDAASLFPRLLAETENRRDAVSATAAYFKLKR